MLVLTVAAFLLLGLLAVAACETTRGRFVRLLADQDLRPTPTASYVEPAPRSDRAL